MSKGQYVHSTFYESEGEQNKGDNNEMALTRDF